MDDHLAKPIHQDELTTANSRWLDDAESERPGAVPAVKDANVAPPVVPLPVEVLDPQMVEQLRQLEGTGDLLHELFDTYLTDAGARITAIRTAVDAGDARGLGRAAHALKGSSISVGAGRVAAISERLEEGAGDAHANGTAHLIEQLDEEYTRIQNAMKVERGRHRP